VKTQVIAVTAGGILRVAIRKAELRARPFRDRANPMHSNSPGRGNGSPAIADKKKSPRLADTYYA